LVVEGRATMRVDGETHELGPGDAVLAPVESDHDLHNTGTTPVRVVVIWGRPSEPVDASQYGTGRAARDASRM
ncbi:MAG: cupin domain-containing protein, partial [Pseudonocardiaceae bacterium]|nr:cupin domain-containing protein [Pseudonocardiaceae bacterium]